MKLFIRDKRILFHVYVVFTLLAILTMFLEQKIAQLLFTIGAGSPDWAFYVFCSATVGFWGGVLSLFWFSLYPVFLLLAYIFALKRQGHFFCIMVVIDTIAVMIIGVYAITSNNLYGFNQMLPDIVVSIIFTLLLIVSFLKSRKIRHISIVGESDGLPGYHDTASFKE